MIRTFTLRSGWRLRAYTAPEAFGRHGPALRTVELQEPEWVSLDTGSGSYLRTATGHAFEGDDWRACFRALRTFAPDLVHRAHEDSTHDPLRARWREGERPPWASHRLDESTLLVGGKPQ